MSNATTDPYAYLGVPDEEPPVAPSAESDEDSDRIDPPEVDEDLLELKSGTRVRLQPLRTFELFALLRIVTRGAGNRLGTLRFDQGEKAFTVQFMALLMLAFPESDVEVVEFARRMVIPDDLVDEKTKGAKEINRTLWDALNEELSNPDPDDLITILEKIIEVEGRDIQGLGKRLMGILMNLNPTQA